MIKEELKNVEKEELEMMEPFAHDAVLHDAWKRVSKGEKLPKTIDVTRYRLPVPENDDVEAWEKAVDNAKAQLEQQHNRYVCSRGS
jgi:hypothetical protein